MKTLVPRLYLIVCCILLMLHTASAQRIQTGKSYVNITKGLSGGTIEVGDILEIRATIAVGNFSTVTLTNVRYTDTIPGNTTYVPGTLKILSNEGLTWSSFTDAADGDRAMYNAGRLRINMGSSYNNGNAASVNLGSACTSVNPTATGGGRIQHNGRPSFYGGVCIMSASYRIQVNAVSVGTIINTYGGTFRYTDGATNVINYLNPYSIAIAENLGLCVNSIGGNAIIEDGGTFGTGNLQNRTNSGIVPGYTFGGVAHDFPNDGSYSIINNLSPTGSTNALAANPDNAASNATISRVHRLWDIMGDHTGSATPSEGNAPVAPGALGGYFVAINASYANNNAIQQTISGLCPNTYYEFSAWFKNICKYCACDTTADAPYRVVSGVRVPNPNFNGPDSSGVNPNLTFTIDGVDYYTTGALTYTGNWVKRGFVYKTGAGQTSFSVTIRNNAPGGGGNDWAIDDVSLATCTPNLNLVPSGNAQVCYGNQVDMSTTVRSYYPNYVEWTWERSLDNGASWLSTGRSGTGTPTLVGGEYEYVDHFPSYLADSSVHNNLFRIRVASTPSNLATPACSFTNTAHIIVLVNNCMTVLSRNQVTVSGRVVQGRSVINWNSFAYVPGTVYGVERSIDKIHYERIGTVVADNSKPNGASYSFTDPALLQGPTFYRIKISNSEATTFSKTVLLSDGQLQFDVRSVVNPVRSEISFEIISPGSETADILLRDNFGRVISRYRQNITEGVNQVKLTSSSMLPAGTYMLQVTAGQYTVTKRIVKAAL